MRQKPDHGEATYVGHGRLRDRVALVTGADSGIGRAVALAFAREGADVAISYLEEHEDARETARLVEEAKRRALLLPGDVADPRHCASIVEKTAGTFGRLDVLVNNAAFQGKAVASIQAYAPSAAIVDYASTKGAIVTFTNNAMERPAQPAEIAPAFVFLACDESRFVNGEVLGVTGGRPLA